MKTCPTCGHPVIASVPLALTRMQRKLFELVDAAGMRGIETRALMDRLYDDDPSGGPGPNALKANAHALNKRLAPHGLFVTGKLYGLGIWRLVARAEGSN